MNNASRMVSALFALALSSCTSLPYKTSEPTFDATNDVFQGTPLWDSNLFAGQQLAGSPSLSTTYVKANEPNGLLISRFSSPGLWDLLKQVDPENKMLASDVQEAPYRAAIRRLSDKEYVGTLSVFDLEKLTAWARAASIAEANTDPLPAKIKKEPLTRAYVISLAAAFYNGQLQTVVNDFRAQNNISNDRVVTTADTGLADHYNINDSIKGAFSIANFRDFGTAFLQSNLDLVQHPQTNQARLAHITDLGSGAGISFESLAFQYFTAYYKGNFVDRDGGQLGKPSLGTTISDTTIANAATVALEAMFDFAVINGAVSNDAAHAIKAPVVYDNSGGTPKWETAKGGEPTLAKVVQGIVGNDGNGTSLVAAPASITKLNSSFTLNLSGGPKSGSFTIAVDGHSTSSIPFNATAMAIQTAIVALNLPATAGAAVSGTVGGPYQIRLPQGLSSNVTADGSGLEGNDNVYTLSFAGKPTGGTFTITIGSVATVDIAFNAPASVVAADIGALPYAKKLSSDPLVGGSPGGPYQITLPRGKDGTPTVMTVSAKGLTGGNAIVEKKYVLEQIAKNGLQGITPAKIKVIRFTQGVAADGAQGLSGLITRTFGGVHIGVSAGLGLLGKVSIGDNNTLANLVETSVGTIASRASEFFASDVLYDVTYTTNSPNGNDPPVVMWLKYLSQ